MKALSIRQPWAWLIINAGKDIENREWQSTFTGPCFIHAAKAMTRADYDACQLFLAGNPDLEHIVLPLPGELERGGIVGRVYIAGCATESDSPWYCGPFGYELESPVATEFTPWKGRLGFFNVDTTRPILSSKEPA